MRITMEQHKQHILQSNMLSRTYHVWLTPPTILAVESVNRPAKALGTAHFAPQEAVPSEHTIELLLFSTAQTCVAPQPIARTAALPNGWSSPDHLPQQCTRGLPAAVQGSNRSTKLYGCM
jgi:hypothetical protein